MFTAVLIIVGSSDYGGVVFTAVLIIVGSSDYGGVVIMLAPFIVGFSDYGGGALARFALKSYKSRFFRLWRANDRARLHSLSAFPTKKILALSLNGWTRKLCG
ncbi:hypothetical protein [Cohnella lupini]|uniref:hypothetical protein n=1 Tax=Cohnella lupini TaxID=1294267 RepID=UPI0011C05699|nr:hypothetical protein [Cohnella lupini]